MNRAVVLFDMDGTLTEPRQKFDSCKLDSALYFLTNKGIHLGIVTGSGLRYLNQQLGPWLDRSTSRYKTHLLPCNGTQYLAPPKFTQEKHKLIYSSSMAEHLGSDKYRKLVKEIIDLQMEVTDQIIPLSGHFIDYRGSMINWCPIGREATHEQREEFKRLDGEYGIREKTLKLLKSQLQWLEISEDVVVKLGGDTSFDIYPTGWDKTYALKHFENHDVWFVGDRCEPDGNDYELYKYCGDQGFISTGPNNTVEIIDLILKKLGEKNE